MKVWKRKTIDFNVVVAALWAMVQSLGIDIPEEVMVGVLSVGNFILRFFTKEPVSEKK